MKKERQTSGGIWFPLKYLFFGLSLEPKIKNFEPEINDFWITDLYKLCQFYNYLNNWKSLKFEILTYFLGMHTKLYIKSKLYSNFSIFLQRGKQSPFFPFFLQRGKQSELCHLVILKCSPKQLDFILLGVEQLKQVHFLWGLK